jgi:hypothetical protein
MNSTIETTLCEIENRINLMESDIEKLDDVHDKSPAIWREIGERYARLWLLYDTYDNMRAEFIL